MHYPRHQHVRHIRSKFEFCPTQTLCCEQLLLIPVIMMMTRGCLLYSDITNTRPPQLRHASRECSIKPATKYAAGWPTFDHYAHGMVRYAVVDHIWLLDNVLLCVVVIVIMDVVVIVALCAV